MNNNVRKITDGAMMTAIVGLLMLINRQLGGIVEMFIWILPLPMVFFTAKYGWKDGLLPLSAMIFLALLFGVPQSLYYFTITAITGLVYGHGVRSQWTLRKLMFFSIGVSIVSNFITTVLFAAFFGYDITMSIQAMKDTFNQTLGSSISTLPIDIEQIIRISLVFGVILSGVLEGLLIHMVSRLLLQRFGFKIPKPRPIINISVPKWTGYIAIVLWAGSQYLIASASTDQIQEIMLIINLLANLYLMYFGYLGAMVVGALKFNRNILFYLVLATIFLLPLVIPAMSIFGFLYITTNWREDLIRRAHSGQPK